MINKRKLQSLIYQLFCMFVGLAVISPIIYCVLVSFMQLEVTIRTTLDTKATIKELSIKRKISVWVTAFI